MTVVVMWFETSERAIIEETFAQRASLRQKYDCSHARLLADDRNLGRFLAIWEFPTRSKAQAYINESLMVHGGKNLADMRNRVIGFYDDLASWPLALAQPFHRAS